MRPAAPAPEPPFPAAGTAPGPFFNATVATEGATAPDFPIAPACWAAFVASAEATFVTPPSPFEACSPSFSPWSSRGTLGR